jgi:hypothetical protein
VLFRKLWRCERLDLSLREEDVTEIQTDSAKGSFRTSMIWIDEGMELKEWEAAWVSLLDAFIMIRWSRGWNKGGTAVS